MPTIQLSEAPAMITTPSTPETTPNSSHRGSKSPFLNVFRKKFRSQAPSPDSGIASDTPSPSKLTFIQRVHMHKNLRDGKLPDNYQSRHHLVAPSTSMSEFSDPKSISTKSKLIKKKTLSVDTINQLDSVNLIEALEVMGDDQPIVARSIPKHAQIDSDPNKEERRLRRNCIYEPEVYDKMLYESLQMCDLLQIHLTDCITSTRAKSPPPTLPFRSLSKNPNPPDADDMRYTTVKHVPLALPIELSSVTSKKTVPPVPPKPSVKPVNKNILSFAV